jgi:hypothetical protein
MPPFRVGSVTIVPSTTYSLRWSRLVEALTGRRTTLHEP